MVKKTVVTYWLSALKVLVWVALLVTLWGTSITQEGSTIWPPTITFGQYLVATGCNLIFLGGLAGLAHMFSRKNNYISGPALVLGGVAVILIAHLS